MPAVVIIPDTQTHGCLFAPVILQRKSGGVARILECAVALIQEKIVRHGVVGHDEIELSVVVHVGEGYAETVVALFIGNPGLLADLRECAVAVVVKKMIVLARKTAWAAHHRLASILAEAVLRRGGSGDRRIVQVELHVAGDVKVQLAVAVVVAERRARGPDGLRAADRYARLLCKVCERAVMIVVIDTILAVIRDVQIRPAVIVEVAHGHAKPPSLIGYACLFGDVGKRAVVIVMKQSRAGRLPFALESIKGRSINQINVRPSVVVIVKNRHTGTRSLQDQILLRCSRDMFELVEPGFFRVVHKDHRGVVHKSTRSNWPVFFVEHWRKDAACRSAARLRWSLGLGYLL